MAISLKRGELEPPILNGSTAGRPPSISEAVVYWNLSIDLIYRRNTDKQGHLFISQNSA